MIKIFPVSTVKEIDNYTILNEPIDSIDLVERASTQFVHEFTRRYSKQHRIIVFAGQGNNGADALAIARLLVEESYRVETFLFNPTANLSPDCMINKTKLLEIEHVEFTEVIQDFEPPMLSANDIVIDGLFGSGLNRPLSGGFAAVVNYINQSEASIVAIDIPSGLFGEDNLQNDMNAVIKADLTLTFGFPKLSFLLADNFPYVGEWKVLDIGLHPDIIEDMETPFCLVNEEDITEVLHPRKKFAHKGDFGHALLVAGSKGKMGAAVLGTRSCLRSGTGLVTVHIPKCGLQTLQTAIPEAMASVDQHAEHFSVTPDSSSYSAIGVGPGLGQHMETATALERLIQTTKKPLVIDADALNALATNKDMLKQLPQGSILTPHPKEFDRLAGSSPSSFERLMKAREFASTYQIILVLKGAYTAICLPNRHIYFNSTGNPGMATAGSGDVLTGIILGLLAQGYEPEVAATIGVYLHGAAGDLAAVIHTEESLIASDITDMLGKAFKQIK
ncbi:NAD(P)H-hydrate dehydratase [Massilibacteroides sp.]|uniref:NAD(P)H-hydrate dehydratase n=1 Tax=Massilibacteroides sp. TaxID=2034766 RepID=UPI002627F0EE|nr:NAD(P)H-hydrate dehydratase [Massilibacteroides sp.]MDD4515765.1 NAD(P)H-hydrate dehydratase [Massilibacteroides sp.]